MGKDPIYSLKEASATTTEVLYRLLNKYPELRNKAIFETFEAIPDKELLETLESVDTIYSKEYVKNIKEAGNKYNYDNLRKAL
jgi:hypothetical protein